MTGAALAVEISARIGSSQLLSKELIADTRTLARSRHRPPSFRVGAKSCADLHSMDVPHSDFHLLRYQGGRFLLKFAEHWQGWVFADGRLRPLAELVRTGLASPGPRAGLAEYALAADSAVQIRLGIVDLVIRATPPLAHTRLPKASPRHSRIWPYLLSVSVLFLTALWAIDAIDRSESLVYEAPFEARSHWVQIASAPMTMATETMASKTMASKVGQHSLPAEAMASLAAMARESRTPNESPRFDRAEVELLTADEMAATTVEEVRARARQAGLAGALAKLAGRAAIEEAKLHALVASIRFDHSAEAIEQYGGQHTADVEANTGAWGYGLRKIGPGSGDGKDWGTIAAGPFALGSDDAASAYEARALTRAHRAKAPVVSAAAAAILESGLGYDVIRGNLGMRKRRFQRCFEEHAQGGMPAEIVLGFRIAASGQVERASVQQVAESPVRSCVEDTLLSIRFPQSSDGKAVEVRSFALGI